MDDAQSTIATLKSQLAASQAEAASCAKSLAQAEADWQQQEQDQGQWHVCLLRCWWTCEMCCLHICRARYSPSSAS